MIVYVVFYEYQTQDPYSNSTGNEFKIVGVYTSELAARRERKRLLKSKKYANVYIDELFVKEDL